TTLSILCTYSSFIRVGLLFFYSYPDHRILHSFPTRRSSDLVIDATRRWLREANPLNTYLAERCFKDPSRRTLLAVLYDAFTLWRSEEHTSELQSQSNLVCRLLLEKKKQNEEKRSLEPALDQI